MNERALQIDDQDYRVWENLAAAYEWVGQDAKARQAYARKLQLLEHLFSVKSDDPIVRADLAITYSRTGEPRRARTHLEAALALAPQDPEVLARVGEAYEHLGDRANAVHYLRAAEEKGYEFYRLEVNPDLRSLLSNQEARRALVAVQPSKRN